MLIEIVRSAVENGNQQRYHFDCQPGETIYEAAERASIKLPLSCKNGVCHICRAKLLNGRVVTGSQKKSVSAKRVVAHHTDPSEIMLCKTWPETSCEIEVKSIYGPGELPVRKMSCQVLSVEAIKGHVYQVELLLPAGKTPEFYAGQYLSLNLPDRDEPAFFSIASRPGLREVTLHIQADPHLESALEVVEFLQACATERNCVSVSLPFGEACLSEMPSKPLVLIAAGTGFAQMKSIIEHLLSLNYTLPISLYWGVRKQSDMYLQSLAEGWADKNENIQFKPLIADIDNIQDNAHHNQLSDEVLKDHPKLENSLVYVSGSPKLVFSAMDALTEAGLPEDSFFSDVLAYASRD